MKSYLLALAFLFAQCNLSYAQQYRQKIEHWQTEYKREFLQDNRSPLTAKDTGLLHFFPVDSNYCVLATLQRTPRSKAFDMATHSGKTKRFKIYGILSFSLPQASDATPIETQKKVIQLPIYENLAHKQDSFADYLFLPFTDFTGGAESYGGGRYIDLLKKNIKGDTLEVDFNKAYNPWCVFKGGYSCPIPPDANRIQLRIPAGEMMPDETIRAKE
ncbi:MAG: DUF1684 domain-containing protein [Bacteroidetes bacterium]|nr:DUF1684 domain-containing protein [Bacteroidota bacterium]